MTANSISAAAQDSRAPAITRAAAILRLLGKSERPMGVQAIARELGLVPSTCLYVLRALVAEQLVAFDTDSKLYTLEAGILTLAQQWLRRSRFTDQSQPVLDDLAGRFGTTMMGVRIFGLDHMVVVSMAQSMRDFQLSVHVGNRFPALISATGRCVAAFGGHDRDALRSRFDGLRWDDPPAFDQWMAQVDEVARRGYAMDDGNYIGGVTVLAAPVWQGDGGSFTHALVAVGIGSVMRREGVEALADALRAGAATVTQRLGG